MRRAIGVGAVAEQLPLGLPATGRPPRWGFNSTHWAGRGRGGQAGRQAEGESICAATGGWDSARGVSHRPIDCRDAVVGLAPSVSQDSRHRDLKRPAVFGGIIKPRERERPILLTAEVGRPSGGSLTPQRKRNYIPLPLLWSWVWPLFSCCSQSLCFLQLLLFALLARCSLSISLSPTWPDIIQTNLGHSRALAPCLLPIHCS